MHASYINKADGSFITGAVGPETGGLSIEEGKAAARQCALNLVATLKNQLGDLDRVEQIIKVSLSVCRYILLFCVCVCVVFIVCLVSGVGSVILCESVYYYYFYFPEFN